MPDLRLGGHIDAASHQRTDTVAAVPSADLTTHAVIVGMTGSGKTGLGVVAIEECLRAGVPALLIDPKGDLTNLCLMFPDFAATDFRPWVDEAQARQAGLSLDDFAAQQAVAWRDGLAGWAIGADDVRAVADGVERVVYTPGSSAGVPLNIVGSLSAPPDLSDVEAVQDEIDSYVTSVLSLIGIDADPLSSREHILLANLIRASWDQGRDLDLPALVAQVQQPPLRKLGVLELDQFFPPQDRQAFALRLNGLLASPSFATWMRGAPVDIEAMLRGPDGRPRCAIVTTAHLSDEQRLSTTALVLSKLISWMRRQSGTTDLRTLLYMDEVAGYLPPTANPPTKKPLMTLLKQARAFGVGVVLSTQNPVDVDYKALSNAGTWLIGRLQTERDKARLVDGLTSAAGGVDVKAVGDTISGLGKREFVLKRAAKDVPEVITSRWAMSYLRGPMTRDQIAAVTASAAAGGAPATTAAPAAPAVDAPPPTGPAVATLPPPPDEPGAPVAAPAAGPLGTAPLAGPDESPVMPTVAAGTVVSYLDPAASWAQLVGAVPGGHLRAAAVARVNLRYDDTKASLVHDEEYEAVLFPLPQLPDAAGFVPVDYDERDLLPAPPVPVVYGFPAGDIRTKTWWTSLKRSLTDQLVRTRTLEIQVNKDLGLYSRVGESPEQFAARCVQAADDKADAATAALQQKYETKLAALRTRYGAAQAEAARQAGARTAAYTDAAASVATSVLGGLFGGRRSRASVSAQARRMQSASARVDAAQAKVDTFAQGIADLEAELAGEVARLDDEWTVKAGRIQTLPIPLEKTDVAVADLRLVWIPVG